MKKNIPMMALVVLFIVRLHGQGASGIGITVAGAGIFPNQLYLPAAVYLDSLGSTYVVDRGNNRIQKFAVGSSAGSNGVTVAGGNGPGRAADQLNNPVALFVDNAGNVYVADQGNNRVQMFPAGSDSTTHGITVAGNDTAGNAANELSSPSGVFVTTDGTLYVADDGNDRVQKFTAGSNSNTPGITVAGGNGLGNAANQLANPQGIFIDLDGNLYIADFNNNRIQKFGANSTSDSSGVTVAGNASPGSTPYQLNNPTDIWIDTSGNIYVMDYGNNRVQRFPSWSMSDTNAVTIAGGNGAGNAGNKLDNAPGIYLDPSGNLYVADQSNDRIQFFMAGSTQATYATTIAGGIGANNTADQLKGVEAAVLDGSGYLYAADLYNNRVQKFPPGSTATTPGITVAGGNGYGSAANQLAYPNGLFVDSAGNLYVADQQNQRIQYFAAGSSSATNGITVAGGNGSGNSANQLHYPTGVFVDSAGNIYVADQYNNRVQKFAAGSNVNTDAVTVAANQLNSPRSIYVDNSGNLYVTNTNSHTVLKFAPGSNAQTTGVIVAGDNYLGDSANQLSYPTGVWVDKNGYIYVADNVNARIQKFPPASDSSTSGVTVAGGNGTGNAANQLNNPLSVFVDDTGNIYIADDGNFRVQKWTQISTGILPISSTLPLVIAPNPSTGSFSIYLPKSILKTLHVYNTLGQIISTLETDEQEITLDGSQWAQGVYICVIQAGGQNYQSKMVKE